MDFAKRLLVIADYLDRVYDLKDPTYMEHYSENIKKILILFIPICSL